MKIVSKMSALAFVMAVCLSITACTLFSPHEKPVDTLVKAANSGQYEKILDVLPEKYTKMLSDEEKESMKGGMKKAEEKISYKVTSKVKIEGDNLKNAENTENTFMKMVKPDMENMVFTEGYELDVEFKMGNETENVTISVYKIDGKWCFGVTSLMSMPSMMR